MKRGIFMQIIVLTFLVAVWSALHWAHQILENRIDEIISERPIFLFSWDEDLLRDEQRQFEQLHFISETVFKQDSDVLAELVSTYDLEGVESVVSNGALPHLIQLRIEGSLLNEENFNTLDFLIGELSDTDISTLYNSNYYRRYLNRKDLLDNSYFLANALLGLLLLIVAIFMRIHYEHRSKDFWRVYSRAGGFHRSWGRQFVLDSAILCIIPVGLISGIYYLSKYYYVWDQSIEHRYFIGKFLTLLLAVLLSRLFLRRGSI